MKYFPRPKRYSGLDVKVVNEPDKAIFSSGVVLRASVLSVILLVPTLRSLSYSPSFALAGDSGLKRMILLTCGRSWWLKNSPMSEDWSNSRS